MTRTKRTGALLVLSFGLGVVGYAVGDQSDPFEALISANEDVLVVAHGCGYSREALDDLSLRAPNSQVIVVYMDPREPSDCESAVERLSPLSRVRRRVVGQQEFCRWLGRSARDWLDSHIPEGGVPAAIRDGRVVGVGWPAVAVSWDAPDRD